MGADMDISIRNKISSIGLKGKRIEGKLLKEAGEVLAKGVSDNINRSRGGVGYTHLKDSIQVSNVKTNAYGERSLQVGASKDKSYILKFLELGTSKMSAQTPMEKGISQTSDDVGRILSDGYKDIMRL